MSTTFFNQASRLIVDRSNFNSVAGNQYINNYNVPDLASPHARKNSILNQYRDIRTGDLQLHQILLTEEIDEKERLIKYQIIPRGSKFLRYTRTVKQATIIGKEAYGTFLEVEYGGTNGREAWRRDLEQYCEQRHPNVIHLFAINYIEPALIFSDNLIPIMKLLSDGSPVMKSYLYFRVGADMSNVRLTYGAKFHSESFENGGFFLNPNTGLICAATHCSYFEKLPTVFSNFYATAWQALTSPLHILQSPNDFNIFQYFDSNWIGFHNIIASIPTYQIFQANTALPITLGSVMYLKSDPDLWNDEALSRPLKIIGQFPNAEYDPALSDDHFKPGTLMDNGWTRCTLDQLFESNVIPWYNWPRAYIYCRENLRQAWLSQAQYVDMNKKQNYVIAESLGFALVPESPFLPQVIPTNLYLFIAPIQILPSPENGTLVDWGENGKTYYWSLDPDGKQRLSDKVSDLLGLPRFQPRIDLPSWTDEQYEAIFQYQDYKGCDPYSDDYACEHGWPLVDLIHTQESEQLDEFDTCDVNDDSSDEWEDLAEAESGSTNSGTDSEAGESLQRKDSDGDASVEVNNIPYPYWFQVPMHFQQRICRRGCDHTYPPQVQQLKCGCGASPWLYGLLTDTDKLQSARSYFDIAARYSLFTWQWIDTAQNFGVLERGTRKRSNSLPRSFKPQKPVFVV